MADIRPFCAVRPKEGLEDKIAALPYDVYNRKEAREVTEKNPLSFLRIDRAETQFAEGADMYAPCIYEKASSLLQEMLDNGQFIREEMPCYYIYELTMDGRSQTGIVACASVDDYQNQVIKKHENTRAEKEEDRIRHVDVCSAQTGPIFLAYRARKELRELVEMKKQQAALYDFTSEDGIRHRVWRIDSGKEIAAIQENFRKTESIYIADGHHRCASAVKVALKRRAEHPDYTGREEFNYFLSVLFPDEELMIMDYNRVVKDLNGYTPKQFLEKLSEKYQVELLGEKAQHPKEKGQVTMFLEDNWYLLTYTGNPAKEDPVARLDVSVLQREVLTPILGIADPKTDKRIDFVGGIRGLAELEKRVHEDCRVAFAMYPTSIAELFAVSDAGLLMPPKSTWFEPKLRSGLFIHQIER
jgi:uncharacterized protein (DUF1015 family)